MRTCASGESSRGCLRCTGIAQNRPVNDGAERSAGGQDVHIIARDLHAGVGQGPAGFDVNDILCRLSGVARSGAVIYELHARCFGLGNYMFRGKLIAQG